jgi:FAD:protein FMN transferase
MTQAGAVGPPTVSLAGPGEWERRVHVEHVWGTVVSFDLRAPHFGPEVSAIIADAVRFLHRVDAWFSTYRVDTPITLIRNGILPLQHAPATVQSVLAECRYARELTHGMFDPWIVPGGVDPSGYVKGWAAGKVADGIVHAGVPNVCVNAAGDVACRGQQAPGEPWALGITDPRSVDEIVKVVHLEDGAVATSGLYERGAHITNPLTGGNDVYYESATVVGPDAGLADALATATLIAGPAAAAWFAALPEWSVYLIRDGSASYFGPAFDDPA